jgi:hypothetical protein
VATPELPRAGQRELEPQDTWRPRIVLQVHAWLMHSVDCIEGNAKAGVKFWGAIADTYNNTIEPHRQRTQKNLKDHWFTYNKQVSLFNQIYNQESSCRQSGADNVMVLETAKERYKRRTEGSEFKRFHWWDAVKHQPKWRAKYGGSISIDPWVSLSEPIGEEEVSHPMGHDRAKVAARKGKGKGKGKANSSSQSETVSVVGGMMSTLKKMSTSFVKAQLWKQWNKLKDRSTVNMDEDEFKNHCLALKLLEKDLNFAEAAAHGEEDVDEEDDE